MAIGRKATPSITVTVGRRERMDTSKMGREDTTFMKKKMGLKKKMEPMEETRVKMEREPELTKLPELTDQFGKPINSVEYKGNLTGAGSTSK